MEGLNKFKVLTVVIVFMFLFVVAAIYTNTKDVSTGKTQLKNAEEKEQLKNDIKTDMENVSSNPSELQGLAGQMDEMNSRINELNEKFQDIESGRNGVCKIYGIMSENGAEQLSVESALQEVKDNGRDLVLTCSF